MKSERCSQVDLLNTHTDTQRGGRGGREREREEEGEPEYKRWGACGTFCDSRNLVKLDEVSMSYTVSSRSAWATE